MSEPNLLEQAQTRIELEYWLRDDLSFKLHAAQLVLEQTLKKSRGQLFIANCSRQWGKSYWACKIAVETANRNQKAQIRYGAAFQSELVDYIIPAFEKILENAPPEKKGKKVGNFYIFPNGSRIKLVGLDKNPNGLRGNTLDLIIIDECGYVTNIDYIYKSIIIPATLHRPNCKIIFISTPPASPAHPFMKYVKKAELEGSYVKLDIYSNPLTTEDGIKRMADEMGGFDSTTFRRECLCEFVTDSDLAIIPEWKDSHIQEIERDDFFQYYHKYTFMDLGVKDLTACIFGYYDFRKAALIVEDEFDMNGPSMNTNILVGAIRAKEKALWDNVDENGKQKIDVNKNSIPYRRISDNNWPILIQDLSTIHNLNFILTDKDNLEAMINEVRLLVQAGRLVVHPRCQKLIGCLRYGIWNDKKKAFARSSVYGHFDHLAALVYGVRNLATNTNPIPPGHGFESHTAWMGNIKQGMTKNAQIISQTLIKKPRPVNTSVMKRRPLK